MSDLTVCLRFRRADAPVLQALAHRARTEEVLKEAHALFARAASDAARGEPMRLTCSSIQEAEAMAAGFTLYGVTAPTIEARAPQPH